MPIHFRIIVLLLIAYGSLPIFLDELTFTAVLFNILVGAIGVALLLSGLCLYHRKPVWERRTAPNGQSYLELVPVWRLRDRLGKRICVICFGLGVGLLIATFLNRAPQ
jgi:hypothetical protein